MNMNLDCNIISFQCLLHSQIVFSMEENIENYHVRKDYVNSGIKFIKKINS